MLDWIGRWLLRQFDYRVAGLLALVVVLAFLVRRKWTQSSSPPILEALQVALGFLSILGGLLVMVVFLFTKPPAIGELSSNTLGLIGIFVPIATGYLGLGKLKSAFFPPRPPRATTGKGEPESGP